MNQLNVDALRDLLGKYPYEITVRDFDRRPLTEAEMDIAHWLAARGVLVPSALTVEQITPAVDGWTPSIEEPDVRADAMAHFVSELERIAKGEPAAEPSA